MKFIKRDIDKRLLVLVVTLLILLASLTIYYEVTFHKLLNRYKRNQEMFGDITAGAVIEQFNKTSNLRENVLKYKEYLEKKYDDLDTLNKKLKNQIEELKAELTLVKSQVEYQKAKEMGPTENFRLFQNKNDEINKLKEKIKELCSKLQTYNLSGSSCVGIKD